MNNTRLVLLRYLLPYIAFTSLICCERTYAQISAHQLPKNYALPSPEAAGMTKVADIPVNLSTGQANISIPLFTINTGKLTLPISLSYDASGIRVEQEASEVGLGWALNAGGAITRTIRDKDDYLAAKKYYEIGGPGWDGSVHDASHISMSEYFVAYNVTGSTNYDAAPDLYMYNFAGLQGKFVDIGGTYGIKQMPKQNIKIQGGLDSWQLVDGSGMIYDFGGTDVNGNGLYETNNLRTITSTGSGSTDFVQSHRVAWCVKQMSNYDKTDFINFTYQDTYTESVVGRTSTQMYQEDKFDYLTTNNLVGAVNASTLQRVSGKVVKMISFNGGTVEFINTTNSREDYTAVNSAPRLERIIVRNSNGVTLREIEFNYGYFIAGNSATGTPTQKRLKLNYINVISGSNPAEKYSFLYNSKTLPAKNSYAQDHWGYYNGHDENTTLIPKYSFINPDENMEAYEPYLLCPSGSPGNVFHGAERRTGPQKVYASVLQQITYPTGGTVKFDMEAHAIDKDYDEYDFELIAADMWVKKLSSTQWEGPDGIGSIPTTGPTAGTPKYIYEFIIPDNKYTHSGVYAKFGSAFSCPDPQDATAINHAISIAALKKRTSTSLQIIKNHAYGYNSATQKCDDHFKLLPGEYIVEVGTRGLDFRVDASIAVMIPTQINLDEPYRYIGGLRIRAITYTDPVSGFSKVQNYNYNMPADPAKSSGYMHVPISSSSYVKNAFTFYNDLARAPGCWYQEAGTWQPIPCCYKQQKLLVLSSTTNVETGDGAHVNYEYVTITEEQGQNGKEITKFSKAPGIYLTHLEGLPLHSWMYNSSGGLVQENTNEYTIQNGSEEYYGYRIDNIGNHPCSLPPNINDPNGQAGGGFTVGYNWVPLRMRSEWVPLTQQTTIQYFDNSAPLTTVEDYTYNPLNQEMAKVERIVSNGRKSIQYIKYPNDYLLAPSPNPSAELNAVQVLNNQHAQNQVIEKYSSVVDNNNIEKVISGSYVGFSPVPSSLVTEQTPEGPVSHYTAVQADNLFNIETVQPLPAFQPSAVTTNGALSTITKDNSYKLQYSVLKYDSRLNPLETKNAHGTKSALLWMYEKALLSAEVTSAGQDEMAYSSFEDATNNGNWTYSVSAINATDKVTGQKSCNLSLGSLSRMNMPENNYIVSYWRKGGSSTVNGTLPSLTGATFNGWTYYEHRLSSTTSATLTGSGLIDEVRLYPADARMKTWCHSPLIGINSTCDENNHIQYYEYDPMGRLSIIRDQNGNIVKKMEYGIQQPD